MGFLEEITCCNYVTSVQNVLRKERFLLISNSFSFIKFCFPSALVQSLMEQTAARMNHFQERLFKYGYSHSDRVMWCFCIFMLYYESCYCRAVINSLARGNKLSNYNWVKETNTNEHEKRT